ncbi:hypothetical protein [Cupriavidus sp. 2SB]|uniref:hypothetical protein n=1 Tax=unclassified Cupriavidus TaxID=2640874 RepID=UPI0010F7A191|nr:hypothetical protein [Cupriavidus sp. 2SB]
MPIKTFTLPLIAATFAVAATFGNAAPAQANPATAAAAEYLPAKADFIGKWKIYGATVRPPSDLGAPATPEQTAAAYTGQRMLLSFYRAFDYLEIDADGRFNFHQPGDQTGDRCVWCGTWSFHNDSLWLDLPNAPRLDIYAKGGKMQMTYTSEIGESSRFKWQVVGWEKVGQ